MAVCQPEEELCFGKAAMPRSGSGQTQENRGAPCPPCQLTPTGEGHRLRRAVTLVQAASPARAALPVQAA